MAATMEKNMADAKSYSNAIDAYNTAYNDNIKELKNLQEKALDVLSSGKDCLCSLPTGYGKSLVYELLPFVEPNCLVIVIAPLSAIIAQQVQKLGDQALFISKKCDPSQILNGTVNYVFTHPEDILNNPKLNDMFRSKEFQKRKIYLVIDEAHCILEWGDEFRPDFKNLAALRSLFRCQVLALTATVTEKGQKEIIGNLLMKDYKNAKSYSNAIDAYNTAYNANIKELKNLQEKALDVLSSGKDCLCSLPTGYGKSLVYELLPFVEPNCLVIVIAPLSAIIAQQVQKLGDQALFISKKCDPSQILNGTVNYVFTHPEDILNNPKLNDMFRSKEFQKRKIYLVIDEAHCILEWGDEFRPDFKNLAALRSLFRCQVLALTATVTEKGQKEIIGNLLMKDYKNVSASPTKDNIQLIVFKRPSPTARGNTSQSPYDYVFEPTLKELLEKNDSFPITVIYCKSIQWIGYGYELAREILGERFYAGERKPENARVVMFHSAMEDSSGKLKDNILSSLQRPVEDCCIRLIIASVALGMGADLKYVERVIHAGPPTTLETYVQEIGRCGRSGINAKAILYYNSNDLGIGHMQESMKNYCRSETCKRELINRYFGFLQTEKTSHCCNICTPDLGMEWDFQKLCI